MKTQAVVFCEDHKARLTDIELPSMSDSRVRVEAVYSGISCGTEVDCLTGRQIYVRRPLLTGYQTVGRIVETGDKVEDLKVGDMVFVGGEGALWDMDNIGGTHSRESVWEAESVFRINKKWNYT